MKCELCGSQCHGNLCKQCSIEQNASDTQTTESLWDCSKCGAVHSDYYDSCPR